MIEEEKNQFAVLIDADNISPKYAPIIFQELEAYGFPSCRRIYGNWSKANGWNEELLLEYSIIPVQQFSYTSGKNATDMAMVIDAMDLLYGKKVDGFCIVTSDSDFTRLAMRLREEHMYVIGMGESKTPVALTRACNKFIHLNLIYEADRGKEEDMESDEIENVTSLDEISYTIADIISENGNAPVDLGKIGNRLNAKYSDFDVRNYGYTKLSVLIDEEMDNFMLVQEDTNCYVEFKELTSRETIEEEVIHFVKKNGGSLDNLSAVTLELKDKHSGFNIKDYGYSRMSSFLQKHPLSYGQRKYSQIKETKRKGRETMIFDTHAHYDDKQFDQDREELLASMKDNGIGTIVDVGSNMETSTWIVEAVTRYPMMYGAVGVHPSDTAELKESDIDTLKKYRQWIEFLRSERSGLIITGMNQNAAFRRNGLKHRSNLQEM